MLYRYNYKELVNKLSYIKLVEAQTNKWSN